jgi:translocation and assembly module TamA
MAIMDYRAAAANPEKAPTLKPSAQAVAPPANGTRDVAPTTHIPPDVLGFSMAQRPVKAGFVPRNVSREPYRNRFKEMAHQPVKESFEQVSEVDRMRYVVRINGNIPIAILKELKNQSVLVQDEKVRTLSGIEMANMLAKEDVERFKCECEKAGYFDAAVNVDVVQQEKEIFIAFNVDLGGRYTIKERIIQSPTSAHTVIKSSKDSREFVVFKAVTREKDKIKSTLQNNGYFFAETEDPLVEIDREEKQATITYRYVPGNLVVISDLQVSGEGNVPKSFVTKHISIEKGAVLKQSDVINSRTDLINSGLFAEVTISAEKMSENENLGEKKPCPPSLQNSHSWQNHHDKALVKVEVVPAPPHTIGGGVYFAATEGVVVSAMWQNKNFMNKALDVGAIFQGGTKEMSATAFFNKPNAFGRHNVFHADASLKQLNTIAYEGQKYSLTAGLIRHTKHTKPKMTYSVLPTIEYGALKQNINTINQALFGVKVNATLNMSNHVTTPTSGFVLDLTCHPYFGSLRPDEVSSATTSTTSTEGTTTATTTGPTAQTLHANGMCVFSGSAKGYVPLDHAGDVEYGNVTVIAALMSCGTIAVKDFACIPFDKRFYGGGRNSVRAYGYQLSGELNSEDKPIGGSSLLEFCVEPRIRLSNDFGAVVFFEASRVSKRASTNNNVLYGAGVGVRYFTRFGPIRFDIAVPFERRASQKNKDKYVDRGFQFYISVGQSF